MIDMNDKLMVDRDCFERGCMSIPHTHVRPIKEDEVVWMVKEQPEPTRWKPWVELTDEQIEEIWGNMPMMLNSHNNRTRIVFAKAIDAKLKERNT